MLNKRGINLLIVLVALVALIAGCAAPVSAPAGEAAPGEQPAAEVTIDVLTFTGPQIAEPLQRRGAEFTERTGIKVNVTVVPFSDLYQKILTDLATGTNAFDVYVFAPQWMVDYVEPGYLEPLTDRVANNAELQWEDIAPFFRDFSASYKGEIYTIPLDGDFQMVYYRTDVLKELGMEPPQTWEDYLAIAEAAHGMDMNGDGEGDYGSCISKKRAAQAYWMVSSIASAYLQSQGTAQGGFFDLDTFKPLYGDNEGFRKALEVYKATTQFGPPEELNLDVGDTRGLWTAGRCALSIDWGDIGTLAIAEGSQVNGKTGAVILPGSTQVLDRATGKLVPCDANTCPYAVDGVNHAPFAAFGGWSGAINAASDDATKDAAFNYLAYVSAPEQSNVDVTIGATGFNPYRISQFENLDLWIEAGMTEEAANLYLGAIKASLESPNMVLDLRVPQNQRYQQVVLDTAISQFLAGELTLDETVKAVEAGWEEITEELGRDTQRAAYLASLGVTR
ncbi:MULTISPECIES: ABC transporter substrate-binding protein [Caldilinea]|jgi:multiple sugar transport system substrate-binding protein|uniref:Putative ABC transporter substrate binding protein n=1 Tax=Caldilinea aerophila (strain DSM 14535 / JCM 11387 / NBRC 104270 / STL-6-O1) TaxID=926550 RepID=I0I884_CALAS|nr:MULTISPECIES: extracellular solute-binding protein [Caldilinea]BAM01472.1 putative ABC transporter substrate binding protein [Caldilinea aerophila DSM 14535 = NBRC 104270]GIV72811.1 MAG: sugar ABC transporter substrate-binding protein [Caldilinea sp.]